MIQQNHHIVKDLVKLGYGCLNRRLSIYDNPNNKITQQEARELE